MSSSVDNLTQQYAVISVHGEPRPERTVVAYLNEQTLRDLLAEPSIVSLGHHSREEAIACLDGCAPTGRALPANLATGSVDMVDRSIGECSMTQPQFRRGFDMAKHREFVCRLLKNSFDTAVGFFYSKNLWCMVIRAVISC